MNRKLTPLQQDMYLSYKIKNQMQKDASKALKKELKGREINLSKETQIALTCLNGYLERIADAIETIADNTK